MAGQSRKTFYRSEIRARPSKKFSRKKPEVLSRGRTTGQVKVTARRKEKRKSVLVGAGMGLMVLGGVAFFVSLWWLPRHGYRAGPPVRSFGGSYFKDVPEFKSGTGLFLPEVTAKSFIVQDPVSRVVLASKSADLRLLPASTTKIVTALVALDQYKLDSIVTIGKVMAVGQQVGLVQGEKISVENLLYAALVESGNDAAFALADFDPLGQGHFVDLMNKKVESLELTNTHFANPAGLDDPEQYSTVEDLAKLGAVAMANPSFARIVGTKVSVIFSADQAIEHKLTNVNALLGTIPGIRGIKTGYTEAAGQNLVTDVVRDNHEVIVVVLGSEDRFSDTEKLVEWAYSNFRWTREQASLN